MIQIMIHELTEVKAKKNQEISKKKYQALDDAFLFERRFPSTYLSISTR